MLTYIGKFYGPNKFMENFFEKIQKVGNRTSLFIKMISLELGKVMRHKMNMYKIHKKEPNCLTKRRKKNISRKIK